VVVAIRRHPVFGKKKNNFSPFALIRSDPLFKDSYGREGGKNIWRLFVLVLRERKYDGSRIS
jgi:hypothetical protein